LPPGRTETESSDFQWSGSPGGAVIKSQKVQVCENVQRQNAELFSLLPSPDSRRPRYWFPIDEDR
jgi:hypothetical protein